MSIHSISATQASRSFSHLLNKVHYQGESYEIKRGKKVIAKIIPVDAKKNVLKVKALNELFKKLPLLVTHDADDFQKDIQEIRKEMRIKDQGWD